MICFAQLEILGSLAPNVILSIVCLLQVGFHLKPVNFFDANPGMDIAPLPNKASKEHHGSNAACESCGPQSKL